MLLISPVIFAQQSPFQPDIDSLIQTGIEKSFHADFDSALHIFQEIRTRLPGHPVGSFYMAAVFQMRMMHHETDRWEKSFLACSDTAVALADAWIETQGDNAWIYFFRGNVQSYRGLYLVKRGSLVKGFVSARRGVDDLKKAVSLDSTLLDAFVGIGNYKYWSGKYYRYLRWLPVIADERKEGVAEVRKGMKGEFSYWLGLNSLAWILYDQENYAEAIELFAKGETAFDSSLVWIWGLADTHKKAGHYETALNYYRYIVQTVRKDSLESGYNEVLARWKMIQCLEQTESLREIIDQADLIMNRPVEPGRFDKAMECRRKAQEAKEKARSKIKEKDRS